MSGSRFALFPEMSAFKQAAAQYDEEATCPKRDESTGAAHVKGSGCHSAYRARINTGDNLNRFLSLSVPIPCLAQFSQKGGDITLSIHRSIGIIRQCRFKSTPGATVAATH